MKLERILLLARELGGVVLILVFTICKTAKCYVGFIFERAENEPLEQLSCAAISFHRMGHEEGTSS